MVNLIVKFIYHNQDFEQIKPQINEQNVLLIYSQAYMMQCNNLLKMLDEMVVNELVNPQNATLFYLDAILFDSKAIIDASETII